ncbi:hypothetical protein AMES_9025 [Amycolatopsis mediterranei S699]|uniref:DUF305 domain-containing protein n=2 Tax=Amycolatopsis mediterranei TaxID=33910 RepID=A0A0H3DJJ6_AMYMU|nr:conserved hypothetical protein [Amycolatopsis mediterranei U32]AEK47863.1 hypothetical protein RAM_46990 [Amycolatopsis mediterranei S699]AGT89686.1 hypothetical protein B737_9026 [Amycolatopsis mediterranei RB]KDO12155.1 hypothetical protein DV26_03650 [Amycolatopsis mediterranei]AFO82557.1 hypothetical protein AMES_9025 [Amycolatopsis mediterranei S699]
MVLAVVALLLTSCATTAPPQHNAADVMFLQMLIPQNQHGIEIVRLASGRPVPAGLKELAAAIEVTQQTEVDDMRHWLHDWNQPETVAPQAHAGHGGMKTAAPDLVGALRSAPDTEFTRRFLDVLTGQQQGAVELAQTENGPGGGVNAQARDLARRVIESRTAEVKQLLNVKT